MSKLAFKFFIVFWGVFTCSVLFADKFQGELNVRVADDFKHNHSTTIYKLKDGHNTYELNIPKDVNTDALVSGSHVVIEGELVNSLTDQGKINVDSIVLDKQSTKNPSLLERKGVAVLMVNFTDLKIQDGLTVAALDNQLYTSETSVRRVYQRSSSNQLRIIRYKDQQKNPIIYRVDLNYAAGNACDPDRWANDAEAAAEELGLDLSDFPHHMYILPSSVQCPWAGLGEVGCRTSCATWVLGYLNSKSLMAHELGHNFGLHHSSTDPNNNGTIDSEYGDSACVMGSGYRQLNAPQRDRMRWYLDKPTKIATVTENGEFRVTSLDLNVNKLQVLKIPKEDGTGSYYVSFRTNHGPFGMSAPYLNKVSIHRLSTTDRRTAYITSLGVSEKFVDANNHITITNLASSVKAATVAVNLDMTLPVKKEVAASHE